MSIDSQSFKAAMRQFAGAVTVVATDQGGLRAGLTVTSACSVSAEPARMLACVNLGGQACQMIRDSGRMSVNVLATHHEELARRFARMLGEPDESPFDYAGWQTLATGAPVLTDALAGFDCVVDEVVMASTHAVLIGRVVAVSVNSGAAPLLYVDGRFATIAA